MNPKIQWRGYWSLAAKSALAFVLIDALVFVAALPIIGWVILIWGSWWTTNKLSEDQEISIDSKTTTKELLRFSALIGLMGVLFLSIIGLFVGLAVGTLLIFGSVILNVVSITTPGVVVVTSAFLALIGISIIIVYTINILVILATIWINTRHG